jgi:FkbM family methyltransferase
MLVTEKILLTLTGVIGTAYNIGRRKKDGFTLLKFKGNQFFARPNGYDVSALLEVCFFGVYKKALINKGDIVVDIGAHIGAYSVLASKKGAKVIAYEAAHDNYQILIRNLTLNNCQEAIAHNVAVSSGKGKAKLYRSGSSLHSLYCNNHSEKTEVVPTVDLHDVLSKNNLEKIDVLKIDTEGSEYDIILNSTPRDLKRINRIILEYHDYFDHGHKRKELERFLNESGFKVRNISPFVQKLLVRSGTLLAVRP